MDPERWDLGLGNDELACFGFVDKAAISSSQMGPF